MILFRVFDWDGVSTGRQAGGPLFVARHRQGAGRHDAPSVYGAWYCSRHAVSAVAECLQPFRGQQVGDEDFARLGNTVKSLIALEFDDTLTVVDLDDPSNLARRRLRPSQVASMRRPVTQAIAVAVHGEGAAGIAWWSTLNADWANVTLFHERAVRRVRLHGSPERLSTAHHVVREAAELLGVSL